MAKKKKAKKWNLWFNLTVIDGETEEKIVKINRMVEEDFDRAVREIKKKFR